MTYLDACSRDVVAWVEEQEHTGLGDWKDTNLAVSEASTKIPAFGHHTDLSSQQNMTWSGAKERHTSGPTAVGGLT